jgi:hypothetical protein
MAGVAAAPPTPVQLQGQVEKEQEQGWPVQSPLDDAEQQRPPAAARAAKQSLLFEVPASSDGPAWLAAKAAPAVPPGSSDTSLSAAAIAVNIASGAPEFPWEGLSVAASAAEDTEAASSSGSGQSEVAALRRQMEQQQRHLAALLAHIADLEAAGG